MRVITKNILAKNAANNWRAQYKMRDNWAITARGNTEETYNKLLALGLHPTPEDVNFVIGNTSWTRLECDCCEKEVTKVVAFKGVASDEYGETELCLACIANLNNLAFEK